MRTVYVDPSKTGFGYVVFEWEVPTQAGVKRFELEGTYADKCRELTEKVIVLYDSLAPDKIVSELPGGSQNASSAWYLATLQAVTLTYCRTQGIDFVGIKENIVKKHLHGRSKKVTKQQTIDKVVDIYPNFPYIHNSKHKYEKEAIADAMAVYYTHTLLYVN